MNPISNTWVFLIATFCLLALDLLIRLVGILVSNFPYAHIVTLPGSLVAFALLGLYLAWVGWLIYVERNLRLGMAVGAASTAQILPKSPVGPAGAGAQSGGLNPPMGPKRG